MSPNMPYEDDLLMEAESLQVISPLFDTFCRILGQELEQHGEYLDDGLRSSLSAVLNLTEALLEDGLTFTPQDGTGDIKLPSIKAELENVMDEIQTLQAGLKTKGSSNDPDP